MCFLHAPLFHPAMKNVAPVRKALKVKTFFNMLGPMVNPAFPKKQLVGVFSLELARLYGYLYQQSDKQYCIVHSLDGYDEVSLTGSTKIIRNEAEELVEARHFGLPKLQAEQLAGGDSVEAAAKLFYKILSGEGTTAQNAVIFANAGLAIHCAKPAISRADAIEMARESLLSGRAKHCFTALMAD